MHEKYCLIDTSAQRPLLGLGPCCSNWIKFFIMQERRSLYWRFEYMIFMLEILCLCSENAEVFKAFLILFL